jgi:tetratricopeptide (TPR) repeat protein
LLEAERGLDPREPERSWLIVAVLRESHAGPEARALAAALPPSPFREALRGLAAETPADALGLVLPHAGSGNPWVHLVIAISHAARGDKAEAHEAAERALQPPAADRGGPSEPVPDLVRFDAHLLLARLQLERGDIEEGLASAQAAHESNPADSRAPAVAAAGVRRTGDFDQATRMLLHALQLAPRSQVYARWLVDTLRHSTGTVRWASVDAALEPLDAASGRSPEWLALRARVRAGMGAEAQAIVMYRQALAAGAVTIPVERELRTLLARRGDYQEVAAMLARAVPPDVRTAPENLLRGRWAELRAAAQAAPSPSAPAPARLRLAKALLSLGALAETEAVLGTLEGQGAALLSRVRGQRAFERAFKEHVEAGYRAGLQEKAPADFETLIERMRQLALQHLDPRDHAAFQRPDRGVRSLPFLGSWLDHATRTESPTVAHFRRYGRLLICGQRTGGPPEAIVMSLASLSAAQSIRTIDGVYEHDVAIGYDRVLRGWIDAQGGALGGACLADGIWLDVDSSRRSADELAQVMRTDPSFWPRVRDRQPLPAVGEARFLLTDDGGAAYRLLARHFQRRRDGWGSFETLRAHEFGHVTDIKRYFPLWQGLPRALGLLARKGFSAHAIETELERRAQLGSVVLSRDPDMALAEMLLPLPVVEREPEVHDGGYRDGVARMLRYIHCNPTRFPQIDRRFRYVMQLDRLTNDQIREAAQAALR